MGPKSGWLETLMLLGTFRPEEAARWREELQAIRAAQKAAGKQP
jgi:hypothetical protein